jgi:hypothetical protein
MRGANLYSSLLSALAVLSITSIAQATIIEDLIGDVAFAPVSVTLDTPDAATNINGVVHVVGQHNGQAARQLIDLATGTVGQVEFFESLLSAQGNGGSQAGMIREVVALDSGATMYVGQSTGVESTIEPTYWLETDNPQTALYNGNTDPGFLTGVSKAGTFIGSSGGFGPAYGTVGGSFSLFPGLNSGFATDITSDGSFVVGSVGQIWSLGQAGSYQQFSTSNFDLALSGELPDWKGVSIDPVVGDAVFAGSYFDLNTFSERTGFWRADGSFIGAAGENTIFKDFEIWNGELVAAVTNDADTFLISISDFSVIALETILGVKSLLHDDGLFVGSAGFLTSGANGTFLTTRSTGPNDTEVPEPGSLILLGAGIGTLVKSRRSTKKI